jgi:hypothetical protein
MFGMEYNTESILIFYCENRKVTPGMVVHACDPSTQEAETEGLKL